MPPVVGWPRWRPEAPSIRSVPGRAGQDKCPSTPGPAHSRMRAASSCACHSVMRCLGSWPRSSVRFSCPAMPTESVVRPDQTARSSRFPDDPSQDRAYAVVPGPPWVPRGRTRDTDPRADVAREQERHRDIRQPAREPDLGQVPAGRVPAEHVVRQVTPCGGHVQHLVAMAAGEHGRHASAVGDETRQVAKGRLRVPSRWDSEVLPVGKRGCIRERDPTLACRVRPDREALGASDLSSQARDGGRSRPDDSVVYDRPHPPRNGRRRLSRTRSRVSRNAPTQLLKESNARGCEHISIRTMPPTTTSLPWSIRWNCTPDAASALSSQGCPKTPPRRCATIAAMMAVDTPSRSGDRETVHQGVGLGRSAVVDAVRQLVQQAGRCFGDCMAAFDAHTAVEGRFALVKLAAIGRRIPAALDGAAVHDTDLVGRRRDGRHPGELWWRLMRSRVQPAPASHGTSTSPPVMRAPSCRQAWRLDVTLRL